MKIKSTGKCEIFDSEKEEKRKKRTNK
jgi:hypothetical protein